MRVGCFGIGMASKPPETLTVPNDLSLDFMQNLDHDQLHETIGVDTIDLEKPAKKEMATALEEIEMEKSRLQWQYESGVIDMDTFHELRDLLIEYRKTLFEGRVIITGHADDPDGGCMSDFKLHKPSCSGAVARKDNYMHKVTCEENARESTESMRCSVCQPFSN